MKCPKCKKEVSELVVEQEFTTTIVGTKYEDGKISIDLENGYILLNEWLNGMLMEKGKPKVRGCDFCI